MKYIAILFVIISNILFIQAFAGPENCVIDVTNTTPNGAIEAFRNCQSGNRGIDSSTSSLAGLKSKATTIAERAIQLGALFAIGALVWSGIQYNSSFGDDERVKHAKNTMIFAVIGLLILMISYPLVDIIVRFIFEISGA